MPPVSWAGLSFPVRASSVSGRSRPDRLGVAGVRVPDDRHDEAPLRLGGEPEVHAGQAHDLPRGRVHGGVELGVPGQGRRADPRQECRTDTLGPPDGPDAAFIAARATISSVASASTQQVASGISLRLRDSLSATAPRTPRSGIRSAAGAAAPPWNVGASAATGSAAGRASASVASPACRIAESTSARRIRPSGPDPVSRRRSMSCCRASRRTSGETTATARRPFTSLFARRVASSAGVGAGGRARSRGGHRRRCRRWSGRGRGVGVDEPAGCAGAGRPARRSRGPRAVPGPTGGLRRRPRHFGGSRVRRPHGVRQRAGCRAGVRCSPRRCAGHRAARGRGPRPSSPGRRGGGQVAGEQPVPLLKHQGGGDLARLLAGARRVDRQTALLGQRGGLRVVPPAADQLGVEPEQQLGVDVGDRVRTEHPVGLRVRGSGAGSVIGFQAGGGVGR
ncbi:hypothetical protein SMICM304S_10568 [Streptomyces microflavus]